jgi:hypothetical protein
MHFDPQGELLEATRECEAEIFLHWYGNTREQFADEYGPYEDVTRFISLSDADGDVVAVMRLLAPGGTAGLKTLADIGSEPWQVDGTRSAAAAGLDLRSTWEIATIGSRRKSARSGVRYSLALYHGLMLMARANQMSSIVAILDERVRRLLDATGLTMQTLPGTRTASYLGSEASTPVFAHGTSLLDNQRRNAPEAHALVTSGQGLDGVAVPPLDSFRLDARERFSDLDVPVTVAGLL